MKTWKPMAILCILLTLVIGCKDRSNQPYTKEAYMLGTIIQFKVFAGDTKKAQQAVTEAIQRIQEIEDKMTINKEESEVIHINDLAGKEYVPVSSDTFFVIWKARAFSELTEGALDLTVAPLVKLWGIGTEYARVPSELEIEEALTKIDYTSVLLNEENTSIGLQKEGQAIDLGAIAKGYAADEVKRILIEQGIQTAFINLGGNVITLGAKLDGTEWRIGVQNPLDERGDYMGIIKVIDKTVVSSGDYERVFEQDGKRYHHILDPMTGYPAASGLMSTTIIADHSIDADAMSTGVFVLGLEKGYDLIQSIDGVEAIFVTSDKKVYVTSGVQKNFELTDREFQYEKR